MIHDNFEVKYYPGFHIFKTRNAARKYDIPSRVVKVKYRYVIAEGNQLCCDDWYYESDCVVAAQIMVPSDQFNIKKRTVLRPS